MKNTYSRLLPAFIVGCLMLSGCNPMQEKPSDQTLAYMEDFQLFGPEKDELIGELNPAIYRTVNRSNEGLDQLPITVVPQEGVNVQVPSGRYMITGYPVGNIFVYDENNELIVTEIVGSYSDAGAASLTVDIDASYTIRADGGYESVNVAPIPTIMTTESLSNGLWTVGIDIEAGTYKATPAYGHGYLAIYEEGKEPVLYELIGGEIGKTASVIELKDGQVVHLKKVSVVLLETME